MSGEYFLVADAERLSLPIWEVQHYLTHTQLAYVLLLKATCLCTF